MSTDTAGLAGRRILVTAGPTWAPIDAVRHLGNRSSGATGLAISRALAAAGAAVTLLLGPGTCRPLGTDRSTLDIRDFEIFDDLHALVRECVGSCRFDAVVHAAAVSDYRPASIVNEKISSERDDLILRLVRTPKIVDEIKALDPEVLLVKFKLEVARSVGELLSIAQASRRHSVAELIVANDLAQMREGRHRAFLLDDTGTLAEVFTTEELASALTEELTRRLAGTPLRSPGR
jgi:phosphopantothenoylcysteine synthetase/decarboxylase